MSESDDESGGSARPAHMAAGPPPSASGAMSDDEGSESGRDDTERGTASNDARVPTAASRCPGASADDDNESEDGASSRPSGDESEGSDDGAKVEAVVNSVKKPVDKSKWGYLGQVPADKRKAGLDKAPVKFAKIPNRGKLTLPANIKVAQ